MAIDLLVRLRANQRLSGVTMNFGFRATAGAALLTFALASSASATIVFSEPLATPTPTVQYSLAGGQQEASQFLLASTTEITEATFYGAALGGSLPTVFTVQFFSSLNNLPSAELYSSNATGTAVSAGVTDNYGAAVFAITTSITPFTALAGVKYFFGVSDVAGHSYNFGVESSSSGVGAQTAGGIGGYYSLPHSEAFSLSGTSAATAGIPEPASWAMMLVGLGSVGAMVRRQRRSLAT